MPKKTAITVHRKTAAEVRNIIFNFEPELDTGELLTGTPTMTATPTGLTFANVAKNTTTKVIEGVTVAVSQAVQGNVTGGTSGTTYTITASCGTDATPAQTINVLATLQVQDE